MTQEEKAKAYDEALEREKSFQQKYGGDYAGDIFPELRESMNERIIKIIIDCLQHDASLSHQDVDDCITYLEKQKEHKPAYTAKERWKEMRLEVYAQASGNRHEPNYSDDSTKMFSLCDIDEIFEKIGDSTIGSQPAEWSEEDKKDIDYIIQILDDCYAFGKHYLSKKDYENLVNKLIDLRPSWKPSEEQMKHLERCFSHGHTSQLPNQHVLESLYNELKKLT